MSWTKAEWAIVEGIETTVKGIASTAITRAECDRRHPAQESLTKRLTGYLTLLLLVGAVIAGSLQIAGMEAKLARIAEPVAHASPRAGPGPIDAGR